MTQRHATVPVTAIRIPSPHNHHTTAGFRRGASFAVNGARGACRTRELSDRSRNQETGSKFSPSVGSFIVFASV